MTTFTPEELSVISRAQKNVLRLLLLSILVVVVLFLPVPLEVAQLVGPAVVVACLLIGLIGAVFIYRLARAIQDPVPWLYVLCAFIPCMNILALLILNLRATAALRAAGIEVGMMGAKEPSAVPGPPGSDD